MIGNLKRIKLIAIVLLVVMFGLEVADYRVNRVIRLRSGLFAGSNWNARIIRSGLPSS